MISHNEEDIRAAFYEAHGYPFVAADIETANAKGEPSANYWEPGFQITHYGAQWAEGKSITFDPREYPLWYERFLELKQVVHNAGFEGAFFPCWADTQVICKLHRQTEKVSLEECAARYFGKPVWKTGQEKTWDDWARRNQEDIDVTFRLYNMVKITPKQQWLHDEILLPAQHIYAGMTKRGLALDIKNQRELEWELGDEAIALLEKVFSQGFSRSGNLNSPAQVAKYLYDQMGIPCISKTKTGGRSTSAEVLAELALAYPVCDDIRQYKQTLKLLSNYIYKDDDGHYKSVLHPRFNITGTVTGRASSSDPNGQNLSRQPRVRRNYVSRRGTFLSGDLRQVELVIFGARLAKDPTMIDVYKHGGDIHTETAMAVFGASDKESRTKAKPLNFLLLYGGKARMLQIAALKQYGVKFSDQEAYGYRTQWLDKYIGIKQYHQKIATKVLLTGKVESPLGREWLLSDAWNRNRTLQEMAVRDGYNYPTQGTGFDMTTLGLIELHKLDPEAATLTVHDNVVADVPVKDAEELEKEWHKRWEARMAEVWESDVPITVEMTKGKSLGDLK